MNICFVCNEYPEGPHGGVGTMTQLLAEELSSGKHSVKVVGIYNLNYPSESFEIKNGVEIIRIKVDLQNRFDVVLGYWKVSRIIRRWIRQGKIDIIEASDSYGMFSFFARFDKPLILRANGNNTYFSSILNTPLKKKTAFYERNLYKRAFGFCAVSLFTARRMIELYNITEPVKVIYNAVELHKDEILNHPGHSDRFNISHITNPVVFSGTITRKKGIYELVEAILILLEKGIDLTLIINGKDTMDTVSGKSAEEELKRMIPSSYSDKFIFNGHVPRTQLMTMYKQAKAAVFPSFAEAFAFAPMEAMAVGIPTVFSKACSGEELIDHKTDGFLIDPAFPLSIAEAIEFILKHPEEAMQIAVKGKEKIERKFTKEIMTDNTLKFYEEIIHKFNGM